MSPAPLPHATLLLPFALPPAGHAKDLLAALDAPALAFWLARAQPGRRLDADPFAAALPHEVLLAAGSVDPKLDSSPAVAAALMQNLQLPPAEGHWFVLQPVHFHVARDHLVLTDPRQLALDDADARTLFDAAQPLFAELGHEVRYGSASLWFLRADAWEALRTCTPDAAAGHNVDVWLPRGPGERDWRRLHNEVQMLWHLHPLNEQREARGLHRVNALWLWGGAPADSAAPQDYLQWLTGGTSDRGAAQARHVEDTLMAFALASDWRGWLDTMQAIDRDRAAPLLAALRSGTLRQLTLQLTDAQRVREWHLGRAGMRKFWRTPSLARLAG